MNAALALVQDEAEQIPNPVTPYVEMHPGSVLLNVKVRERFLAEIETEIKEFVPDLSTKKSRAEIASLAYKVSLTKAPIEKAAKSLIEDAQKRVKAVNAEKNEVIDALDNLRNVARAPLDEWEEEEAAREAKIKEDLDFLDRARTILAGDTSTDLKKRLEAIELIVGDADRVEAKVYAIKALTAGVERLEKEEADRAELAKLRAEMAEFERQKEAQRQAEAAKLAAERREQEDAERKAREEKAAQERILAAEKRAAEEAADAVRRAADQAAAKAKAEADAEIARLNAEKQALERAEAARIAEEKRLADEELARQKDRDNRAKVLTSAKDAVIRCGATEATARKIVKAIVAGEIPNVSIRF